MPEEAFGKNKRLLTQGMFQQVFDKAPFRVSHRNFLMLARPNGLGQARLGLVIGKKHLRLAVSRNRVKRLARETFRLQHHNLPAIDIIFMARSGLDDPNTNVTEILNNGWIKLGQNAQGGLNQ